jgi:predicted acetyltransferase
MKRFAGNIGYGIRPTERRKGYNKLNLYLGLIEAKKVGLNRVMLDCDASNVGSYRTMIALGGIHERTEIDPSDGVLTSVYYFNVDECINKYKDIYMPMVSENTQKVK